LIFLTVGSQIPFNRLVRAVDSWCAKSRQTEVFGQIAAVGKDGYRPRHFPWSEFLTPDEFDQRFIDASLIVGHAGMGTIISALTYQRPLLMLPRRAALKETRNDHQVATASRFAGRRGLCAVVDETELPDRLDELSKGGAEGTQPLADPFADPALVDVVRAGIFAGAPH